jgi:hypothetical protein
VQISGLANAWQYFFFLSLISASSNGLCALIIPYEWVSRPSARAVRDYIRSKQWNVNVYRLVDTAFRSVLTTSSITIVDKANPQGKWTYFEETAAGQYEQLQSPSGGASGVIPYLSRGATPAGKPRAERGLSPGTQKVLTLTEGERIRSGLKFDRDVVPCITTLRHFPGDLSDLDDEAHRRYYRSANQKCWLIRTDKPLSKALKAYLDAVDESDYQTSTCLSRADWWRFNMPATPAILVSMSFRGAFPKVVRNSIGARAVGGVYGVHQIRQRDIDRLTGCLARLDIRDSIVAHSNGLRKIEIGQLNTILNSQLGAWEGAD